MPDPAEPSLLLPGLDGSNPLAFLAALGTLRTLTLALPDETVRMSWEPHDGAWRPRVWCSAIDRDAVLIETLDNVLAEAKNRVCFQIGDNLNLPAASFRVFLLDAINNSASFTQPGDRTDSDFFAAFGSDAIVDDKGVMADTALRTMSGAGHQHFLKFFRELVERTEADHLERALLRTWDYADEGRGLNLRWDPADDRRYAVRWQNPSADPNMTMRGANRLAIEALPLLPTAPDRGRIVTTAFEGKGARDTYFTWPIWSPSLSLEVVSSLLANVPAMQRRPEHRVALGIEALIRSARITTGKFRNFTPGVAV
ncbi:MAG: hypothetical protein AAGE65_14500 [Planctomycetota bacterium]